MMKRMDAPTYDFPADPVTATPTLTGKHGRAWRIECHQKDTAIDAWMVEAPWAHPAWHSYGITLIHLRETEGMPSPVFYLDGATHEILVFALDPKQERQRIINGGMAEARFLKPMNFAAQITEAADNLAQTRVYLAVRDIVNGLLSPDTDFIRMWIARFGDNMVTTRRRRAAPP